MSLPASNNKTVLVTGCNGFLGAHVTLTFLEKGWTVRGTSRSKDKFDALVKSDHFSKYADRMEFALIEDVVGGDFTEAMKGIDAVAHTASPFNFSGETWEDDYRKPAVDGTTNVLTAATKEPSIKHVVVTSSFAAVGDFSKGATDQADKTYTEEDWNPMTLEQTAKTDDKGAWYCSSKKFAELAALDVAKKANFTLSTICPPMIYGPIVHPIPKGLSSLNESSGQLWQLVSGETKEISETAFPAFADVRTVALAHVKSTEACKDARYLIANGEFDDIWIASFAKDKFPEIADRIPKAKDDQKTIVGANKVFKLDGSKAVKELGLKLQTREETFGDTIKQYLELEKAGK